MATIKYNPTTPSRRNMTVPDFAEITKSTPEKSLIEIKKKHAGRNSYGKITVRHKGGGNKKKYRIIDFKRDFSESGEKIIGVEYDPNRTAYIALTESGDGTRKYIIAPVGVTNGDVLYSSETADIKPGNTLPLKKIPDGTFIYNIELYPGKGGQLVRSAGSAAQLLAKENGMAEIRLPSGEMRLIRLDCRASIGQVSNIDHENVKIGKAGKKRHRGIRPTVRGSAMNPCDHPHGGGEGRCPVGLPSPMTPWGKPTRGLKTRNKKAKTEKFIVKHKNTK